MSRVAVVTGGMGGLGEAICMKLGKMGYKVVATYSPGNTKHNEWLAEMKKQGFEFRAVPVDVTNFESCQQAIAQITNRVSKAYTPTEPLKDIWASDVFNLATMEEALSKNAFKAMKNTVMTGAALLVKPPGSAAFRVRNIFYSAFRTRNSALRTSSVSLCG